MAGPILRRPPRAPTGDLPKAAAPSWWELAAQSLGGMVGLEPISPENYNTPEGQRQIGQAGSLGELLGMIAPLAVVGKAGKAIQGSLEDLAATKGIRAYHGSPHDFDKFSTKQIGTGEGGQAYGHGLYFAESEGTARSYQKQLSGLLPEGWAHKYPDSARAYIRGMVGDVADGRVTAEQAAKHIYNANAPMRQYPPDQLAAELADAAQKVKGRMYEVSIAAHPDELLDWDKPWADQPAPVRAALEPMLRKRIAHALNQPESAGWGDLATGGSAAEQGQTVDTVLNGLTGRDVHQRLEDVLTVDAQRPAVKGIRYWDGRSRESGQGTRNFVIFDDELITIARKYGIPLAVAQQAVQQQGGTVQHRDHPRALEGTISQ